MAMVDTRSVKNVLRTYYLSSTGVAHDPAA